MYDKCQQGKLFFWTVPVPSVWSTVGPVPLDPVEPLCLVQLNLSLESWVHEHKFFSKLQSNDPLGGNVGAVVGAGVVGGRVGTALCGRVTHEPTVYVISSMAISPWYPFPLMPSKTIYEEKRFLLSQKIAANSITFLTGDRTNNHHNFLFYGPRWSGVTPLTLSFSVQVYTVFSWIAEGLTYHQPCPPPPPHIHTHPVAMKFPLAFSVLLLPPFSEVASFP